MENKDLYKVLGLSKDATKASIKKAYRKLAAKHHPDKGGKEEKFKEINKAYTTLSDDNLRSKYDKVGTIDDSHDKGFEDFIRNMFIETFNKRNKKEYNPKATKDDELMFNVNVSIKQIKEGVEYSAEFPRNIICDKCNGEGGIERKMCATCYGTGYIVSSATQFSIQQRTCNDCMGTGVTFKEKCDECSGNGIKKIKETISFSIKEKK